MRSAAKWIWLLVFIAFVAVFLLLDTSGLLGVSGVTAGTAVAKVNGSEISYIDWQNTAASMAQGEEQNNGRGLTLDERRQIDEQAFYQLVNERLLKEEYDRRRIRVTNAEIVEAARYAPPPQFMKAPELQTEGQFDPAKYQRYLTSPSARQQGLLAQLENYYRAEIPREKLFAQVAGDVYISDTRLWQIWRDGHDSVTVSFVAFRASVTKEMRAAVTDAELQRYYDAHTKEYDRPGRAILSIVEISRRPTPADSLATRAQVEALRAEIARGAKFEDVAKRESDDSASVTDGGNLGRSARGRFVKAFEDVAYRLRVGEVSPPVATQFGWHLLRVDERKGDTISVRHILKITRQSDSAATATDRRADQLARLGAGADTPAKFDTAAKSLGLLVSRIEVREGEPAEYFGRVVPSASAWAFSGARAGESSDLFDDERGYYLTRLDSLQESGVRPLAAVDEEVRESVARAQAVEALVPKAKMLANAARTSSLEAAAKTLGASVDKAGPFTRGTTVPGLGFVSEAVGAAFGIAAGAVSAPVRTEDAVYVLRADRRVEADRKAWESQITVQRAQVTRGMRDQRVRLFMDGLRKSAKIDDRRKQIVATQRRLAT